MHKGSIKISVFNAGRRMGKRNRTRYTNEVIFFGDAYQIANEVYAPQWVETYVDGFAAGWQAEDKARRGTND